METSQQCVPTIMIIHADYLWGLKKENQDAYMKGASGFSMGRGRFLSVHRCPLLCQKNGVALWDE